MKQGLQLAGIVISGVTGMVLLTTLIMWLAGNTVSGKTVAFEKELGNISVQSVRFRNRTIRHTHIDGAKYSVSSQVIVPSCTKTKVVLYVTPVSNPFTGKYTYNELVKAECVYYTDPVKKFP